MRGFDSSLAPAVRVLGDRVTNIERILHFLVVLVTFHLVVLFLSTPIRAYDGHSAEPVSSPKALSETQPSQKSGLTITHPTDAKSTHNLDQPSVPSFLDTNHNNSPSATESNPIPEFCRNLRVVPDKDDYVLSCLVRVFPDLEWPTEQVPEEAAPIRAALEGIWANAPKVEPLTELTTRGEGLPRVPLTLITPAIVAEAIDCLPDLLTAIMTSAAVPDQIIIVVSGCDTSTEGASCDIARRSLDAWQTCLPQLEYVLRPGSHDQGSNRNLGALLSRYEILSCFDIDDLPHPNRWEIVYRAFTEDQGPESIDYLLTWFDRHRNWDTPLYPVEPLGGEIDRTKPESRHHGWMSIRKDVWRHVPFVLGTWGEDMKYMRTATRLGHKLGHVKKRLGYYRLRPKKCGVWASKQPSVCPAADVINGLH